MGRIVIGILIVLVLVAGAGLAVFLNPPQEAPPRSFAAEDALPADGRAGWYVRPDGQAMLALPGAYSGYRLYEAASLHATALTVGDGTERGEGGRNRLTFEPPGLRVRRADGTHFRARKVDPQPYTVRDVTVERDGVKLAGLLFAPRHARGVGIVIVHGSGRSDRDNAWYVALADRLARAGAVVLLPDKRGAGRSGGHWWQADFDRLADDAAAWLDLLRRLRPGLRRTGYAGVSQGGRVAPIAQIRHRNADFIAILSSAATTLNEQLRHEIAADARAQGVAPWLARLLAPLFAERVRNRRPGWWRAVGETDPIAEWQAADLPLFIAYGSQDEDNNVPVSRSVARIKAAPGLSERSAIHIYEGVGHGYILETERAILPQFFRDLAEWLRLDAEKASRPFSPVPPPPEN